MCMGSACYGAGSNIEFDLLQKQHTVKTAKDVMKGTRSCQLPDVVKSVGMSQSLLRSPGTQGQACKLPNIFSNTSKCGGDGRSIDQCGTAVHASGSVSGLSHGKGFHQNISRKQMNALPVNEVVDELLGKLKTPYNNTDLRDPNKTRISRTKHVQQKHGAGRSKSINNNMDAKFVCKSPPPMMKTKTRVKTSPIVENNYSDTDEDSTVSSVTCNESNYGGDDDSDVDADYDSDVDSVISTACRQKGEVHNTILKQSNNPRRNLSQAQSPSSGKFIAQRNEPPTHTQFDEDPWNTKVGRLTAKMVAAGVFFDDFEVVPSMRLSENFDNNVGSCTEDDSAKDDQSDKKHVSTKDDPSDKKHVSLHDGKTTTWASIYHQSGKSIDECSHNSPEAKPLHNYEHESNKNERNRQIGSNEILNTSCKKSSNFNPYLDGMDEVYVTKSDNKSMTDMSQTSHLADPDRKEDTPSAKIPTPTMGQSNISNAQTRKPSNGNELTEDKRNDDQTSSQRSTRTSKSESERNDCGDVDKTKGTSKIKCNNDDPFQMLKKFNSESLQRLHGLNHGHIKAPSTNSLTLKDKCGDNKDDDIDESCNDVQFHNGKQVNFEKTLNVSQASQNMDANEYKSLEIISRVESSKESKPKATILTATSDIDGQTSSTLLMQTKVINTHDLNNHAVSTHTLNADNTSEDSRPQVDLDKQQTCLERNSASLKAGNTSEDSRPQVDLDKQQTCLERNSASLKATGDAMGFQNINSEPYNGGNNEELICAEICSSSVSVNNITSSVTLSCCKDVETEDTSENTTPSTDDLTSEVIEECDGSSVYSTHTDSIDVNYRISGSRCDKNDSDETDSCGASYVNDDGGDVNIGESCSTHSSQTSQNSNHSLDSKKALSSKPYCDNDSDMPTVLESGDQLCHTDGSDKTNPDKVNQNDLQLSTDHKTEFLNGETSNDQHQEINKDSIAHNVNIHSSKLSSDESNVYKSNNIDKASKLNEAYKAVSGTIAMSILGPPPVTKLTGKPKKESTESQSVPEQQFNKDAENGSPNPDDLSKHDAPETAEDNNTIKYNAIDVQENITASINSSDTQMDILSVECEKKLETETESKEHKSIDEEQQPHDAAATDERLLLKDSDDSSTKQLDHSKTSMQVDNSNVSMLEDSDEHCIAQTVTIIQNDIKNECSSNNGIVTSELGSSNQPHIDVIPVSTTISHSVAECTPTSFVGASEDISHITQNPIKTESAIESQISQVSKKSDTLSSDHAATPLQCPYNTPEDIGINSNSETHAHNLSSNPSFHQFTETAEPRMTMDDVALTHVDRVCLAEEKLYSTLLRSANSGECGASKSQPGYSPLVVPTFVAKTLIRKPSKFQHNNKNITNSHGQNTLKSQTGDSAPADLGVQVSGSKIQFSKKPRVPLRNITKPTKPQLPKLNKHPTGQHGDCKQYVGKGSNKQLNSNTPLSPNKISNKKISHCNVNPAQITTKVENVQQPTKQSVCASRRNILKEPDQRLKHTTYLPEIPKPCLNTVPGTTQDSGLLEKAIEARKNNNAIGPWVTKNPRMSEFEKNKQIGKRCAVSTTNCSILTKSVSPSKVAKSIPNKQVGCEATTRATNPMECQRQVTNKSNHFRNVKQFKPEYQNSNNNRYCFDTESDYSSEYDSDVIYFNDSNDEDMMVDSDTKLISLFKPGRTLDMPIDMASSLSVNVPYVQVYANIDLQNRNNNRLDDDSGREECARDNLEEGINEVLDEGEGQGEVSDEGGGEFSDEGGDEGLDCYSTNDEQCHDSGDSVVENDLEILSSITCSDEESEYDDEAYAFPPISKANVVQTQTSEHDVSVAENSSANNDSDMFTDVKKSANSMSKENIENDNKGEDQDRSNSSHLGQTGKWGQGIDIPRTFSKVLETLDKYLDSESDDDDELVKSIISGDMQEKNKHLSDASHETTSGGVSCGVNKNQNKRLVKAPPRLESNSRSSYAELKEVALKKVQPIKARMAVEQGQQTSAADANNKFQSEVQYGKAELDRTMDTFLGTKYADLSCLQKEAKSIEVQTCGPSLSRILNARNGFDDDDSGKASEKSNESVKSSGSEIRNGCVHNDTTESLLSAEKSNESEKRNDSVQNDTTESLLSTENSNESEKRNDSVQNKTTESLLTTEKSNQLETRSDSVQNERTENLRSDSITVKCAEIVYHGLDLNNSMTRQSKDVAANTGSNIVTGTTRSGHNIDTVHKHFKHETTNSESFSSRIPISITRRRTINGKILPQKIIMVIKDRDGTPVGTAKADLNYKTKNGPQSHVLQNKETQQTVGDISLTDFSNGDNKIAVEIFTDNLLMASSSGSSNVLENYESGDVIDSVNKDNHSTNLKEVHIKGLFKSRIPQPTPQKIPLNKQCIRPTDSGNHTPNSKKDEALALNPESNKTKKCFFSTPRKKNHTMRERSSQNETRSKSANKLDQVEKGRFSKQVKNINKKGGQENTANNINERKHRYSAFRRLTTRGKSTPETNKSAENKKCRNGVTAQRGGVKNVQSLSAENEQSRNKTQKETAHSTPYRRLDRPKESTVKSTGSLMARCDLFSSDSSRSSHTGEKQEMKKKVIDKKEQTQTVKCSTLKCVGGANKSTTAVAGGDRASRSGDTMLKKTASVPALKQPVKSFPKKNERHTTGGIDTDCNVGTPKKNPPCPGKERLLKSQFKRKPPTGQKDDNGKSSDQAKNLGDKDVKIKLIGQGQGDLSVQPKSKPPPDESNATPSDIITQAPILLDKLCSSEALRPFVGQQPQVPQSAKSPLNFLQEKRLKPRGAPFDKFTLTSAESAAVTEYGGYSNQSTHRPVSVGDAGHDVILEEATQQSIHLDESVGEEIEVTEPVSCTNTHTVNNTPNTLRREQNNIGISKKDPKKSYSGNEIIALYASDEVSSVCPSLLHPPDRKKIDATYTINSYSSSQDKTSENLSSSHTLSREEYNPNRVVGNIAAQGTAQQKIDVNSKDVYNAGQINIMTLSSENGTMKNIPTITTNGGASQSRSNTQCDISLWDSNVNVSQNKCADNKASRRWSVANVSKSLVIGHMDKLVPNSDETIKNRTRSNMSDRVKAKLSCTPKKGSITLTGIDNRAHCSEGGGSGGFDLVTGGCGEDLHSTDQFDLSTNTNYMAYNEDRSDSRSTVSSQYAYSDCSYDISDDEGASRGISPSHALNDSHLSKQEDVDNDVTNGIINSANHDNKEGDRANKRTTYDETQNESFNEDVLDRDREARDGEMFNTITNNPTMEEGAELIENCLNTGSLQCDTEGDLHSMKETVNNCEKKWVNFYTDETKKHHVVAPPSPCEQRRHNVVSDNPSNGTYECHAQPLQGESTPGVKVSQSIREDPPSRLSVRSSKKYSGWSQRRRDNQARANSVSDGGDGVNRQLPPLSNRQAGLPHRPKIKRHY